MASDRFEFRKILPGLIIAGEVFLVFYLGVMAAFAVLFASRGVMRLTSARDSFWLAMTLSLILLIAMFCVVYSRRNLGCSVKCVCLTAIVGPILVLNVFAYRLMYDGVDRDMQSINSRLGLGSPPANEPFPHSYYCFHFEGNLRVGMHRVDIEKKIVIDPDETLDRPECTTYLYRIGNSGGLAGNDIYIHVVYDEQEKVSRFWTSNE